MHATNPCNVPNELLCDIVTFKACQNFEMLEKGVASFQHVLIGFVYPDGMEEKKGWG